MGAVWPQAWNEVQGTAGLPGADHGGTAGPEAGNLQLQPCTRPPKRTPSSTVPNAPRSVWAPGLTDGWAEHTGTPGANPGWSRDPTSPNAPLL